MKEREGGGLYEKRKVRLSMGATSARTEQKRSARGGRSSSSNGGGGGGDGGGGGGNGSSGEIYYSAE